MPGRILELSGRYDALSGMFVGTARGVGGQHAIDPNNVYLTTWNARAQNHNQLPPSTSAATLSPGPTLVTARTANVAPTATRRRHNVPEAQRNAERDEIFECLADHFEHDYAYQNLAAMLAEARGQLQPFIRHVHAQTRALCADLSYDAFVRLCENYQPSGGTPAPHQRLFNRLADVLFASELIGTMRRFYTCLEGKKDAWRANPNLSEDAINARVRRQIDAVFDINRALLARGTSLLPVLDEIEQTPESERPTCEAARILGEAALDGGADLAQLADFIEFYRAGADKFEPTRNHRVFSRSAPALPDDALSDNLFAGASSQTLERSAIQRRGFDEAGHARILQTSSKITIGQAGDKLEIRCLGQGNGRAPFYQEFQTGANCPQHGINSYVLGAWDASDPARQPLTLARFNQLYANSTVDTNVSYNEVIAAMFPNGRSANDVGVDTRAYARKKTELVAQKERAKREAVFKQMGNLHAPVTWALFRALTRHLVRSDQGNQTNTEQVLYYLTLIGWEPDSHQVQHAVTMKRSSDWPYLKQALDNTGGTRAKLLVCYQDSDGHGHYLAFHRDATTRDWHLVDSANATQIIHSPSQFLEEKIDRGHITAFEVITSGNGSDLVPRQVSADDQTAMLLGTDEDDFDLDTAQANAALQRYFGDELQGTRFSDARTALGNALEVEVGAAALAHSLQTQTGGTVSPRDINGGHLAHFINGAAAQMPNAGAMMTAAHYAIACQGGTDGPTTAYAHVIQQLDDLGARFAILSGFSAAPFSIALRKFSDTWYAHLPGCNHADMLLQNVIDQQFAQAPAGMLDLVALQPANAGDEDDGKAALKLAVPLWNDALTQQLTSARTQQEATLKAQAQQAAAAQAAADTTAIDSAQLHTAAGTADGDDQPFAIATAADDEDNLGEVAQRMRRRITPGEDEIIARQLAALFAPPASQQAVGMVTLAGHEPKSDRTYKRIQLDREHRQTATGKPVFGNHTLAQSLRRTDFTIVVDNDTANGILTAFQAHAATDVRFGAFQTSQHLVQAVQMGVAAGSPKPVEFPGGILYMFVGVHVPVVMPNGTQGMRRRTLPLLVRVRADHKTRHVHITEMCQANRANLNAMLNARRWQERPLRLSQAVAARVLNQFEEAALYDHRLDTFDGQTRDDLLACLQQAMLREGSQRPVRLRRRLLRVTVDANGEDLQLLVRLGHGNTIQDIRLDTGRARLELIDETRHREQRHAQTVQRIYRQDANAGDAIKHVQNQLNAAAPAQWYSFADVVQMLAYSPHLQPLPGAAPLQHVAITTPDGQTRHFLVLFEAGELVALQGHALTGPNDTLQQIAQSATAREMLRCRIDLTLQLDLTEDFADEEEPIAGMAALLAALDDTTVAGVAADGDHPRADKLAALVVRGTGRRIDPDYPDLKRYEIALSDGAGGTVRTPVLVRMKNGKTIEAIMPDDPAGINRDRLRPWHFRPQDRSRIARVDNKHPDPVSLRGPLAHLAWLYRQRTEPDLTPAEHGSRTRLIQNTVRRGAAIPIHPDYPEVAKYDTGVVDGDGQPIYLLARVKNAAIVDVRVCNLDNFINMVWHKAAPGLALKEVKDALLARNVHTVNGRVNETALTTIVAPANRSEQPIEPAYPAWHTYGFGTGPAAWALLAKVYGGTVHRVALNSTAQLVSAKLYDLQVDDFVRIAAWERKAGPFLNRLKAPGQHLYDFLVQHVTKANRQDHPSLANYPQLGLYPVAGTTPVVHLLARVENGAIWDVREHTPKNRRLMEKQIANDTLAEGRRIRHAETLRTRQERIATVIARLADRQEELATADEEGRRDIDAARLSGTLAQIAVRENIRKRQRLALPAALQPRTVTNLADVVRAPDQSLWMLLHEIIDDGYWWPVDDDLADMRRYFTGTRDGDGNPIMMVAYFDGAYLIDARIGTESELQRLIDKRQSMLTELDDFAGSYLSRDEIRHIYVRDRYMRKGELMALADHKNQTLVEFLNRVIPRPTVDATGRLTGGTPVRSSTGTSNELFRRYRTGILVNGREIELFAVYEADRPLTEEGVRLTLKDVRVAPADEDDADDGYTLSPPLLAEWRYLRGNHPATVTLPPLVGPAPPPPPPPPPDSDEEDSASDAMSLDGNDVPPPPPPPDNAPDGDEDDADDGFDTGELEDLFPGLVDWFSNGAATQGLGVYRVDQVGEDDAHGFLHELGQVHGPDTLQKFIELLAPQGKTGDLERRLGQLLELMVQPEWEEPLEPTAPADPDGLQAVRFETGILDDDGQPVALVALSDGERLRAVQVDTHENRQQLLSAARTTASAPKDAAVPMDIDAPAPKTVSVKISDALCSTIVGEWLARGDDKSTALLTHFVKGPDDVEAPYAALKTRIGDAVKQALQDKKLRRKPITVATGVVVQGQEIALQVRLTKTRVTQVTIAGEDKRVRRQRVDLEQLERYWDETIGVVEVEPGQAPPQAMLESPTKDWIEDTVFEEVHDPLGNSARDTGAGTASQEKRKARRNAAGPYSLRTRVPRGTTDKDKTASAVSAASLAGSAAGSSSQRGDASTLATLLTRSQGQIAVRQAERPGNPVSSRSRRPAKAAGTRETEVRAEPDELERENELAMEDAFQHAFAEIFEGDESDASATDDMQDDMAPMDEVSEADTQDDTTSTDEVSTKSLPISTMPGVYWSQGPQRWLVQVKDPRDKVRRTVTFAAANYNNSVHKAKVAAEQCAREIQKGTYVYRTRASAEYSSSVSGVTWNKTEQSWQVKGRSPKDKQKQTAYFPISKHGNDPIVARLAAERWARNIVPDSNDQEFEDISGGNESNDSVTDDMQDDTTSTDEVSTKSLLMSGVSGVSWSKKSERWLVQLKDPRDKKRRKISFPPINHNNDVHAAKLAAEKCAKEIGKGTYVYATRAPAEYGSSVPGVTWNKNGKCWQVKVKGPRDKTHQTNYFHIRKYGNDPIAAKLEAEQYAQKIVGGAYDQDFEYIFGSDESDASATDDMQDDTAWTDEVSDADTPTARTRVDEVIVGAKLGTLTAGDNNKLAAFNDAYADATKYIDAVKRFGQFLRGTDSASGLAKHTEKNVDLAIKDYVLRFTDAGDDTRLKRLQIVAKTGLKKWRNFVKRLHGTKNMADMEGRPSPAVAGATEPRPTSAVRGVSWSDKDKSWLVRAKARGSDELQIVIFPISKHDNDIIAARDAAEECAPKVRDGTYVHQGRRQAAEYTSSVKGVTWNKGKEHWQVRFSLEDGRKKSFTFPIRAYDNNVKAAQEAAERCAQAGPGDADALLPPKRQPAEYTSSVKGVSWNKRYERWQVRLNENGRHRTINFRKCDYDNDVVKARLAAEQRAQAPQDDTDVQPG